MVTSVPLMGYAETERAVNAAHDAFQSEERKGCVDVSSMTAGVIRYDRWRVVMTDGV